MELPERKWCNHCEAQLSDEEVKVVWIPCNSGQCRHLALISTCCDAPIDDRPPGGQPQATVLEQAQTVAAGAFAGAGA